MSKARPSTTVPPSKWAHLSPKERFKASVRRVMSIHRGMTFPGPGAGSRIGAEPGVDPRRPQADATYGHIQVPCHIEIIDYSAVRTTSRNFNNAEFVEFMDQDSPDPVPRAPWVKVRWINIAGVSWDVIKALAIKYNLHPLALEDVIKGNPRTRSKADYYTRHLFLRVLCHQLSPSDPAIGHHHFLHSHHRTASPEPMEPIDAAADGKFQDEATQLNSSEPDNSHKHHHHPILPTSRRDIKSDSLQSEDGPNSLTKLLKKEKEVCWYFMS